MEDRPVLLQFSDINVPQEDSVVLDSPALVNALIRDQAGALQFLSEEVAPVDITTVSIDEECRVVVTDPGFAGAVRSKLDQPSPEATNGICGWRCSSA